MDKDNISDFELELENLINSTTQLTFPFLSGDKKKREILLEEKIHIDSEIDCISEKYQIEADKIKSEREKIWDNAMSTAENKFCTLSPSLRMNSFFFAGIYARVCKKSGKMDKTNCI